MVDVFRREAYEIAHMNVSRKLLDNYEKGATLYIDEATDAQVPRVAMLTNLDGDDKPMMLGLSRVASHYSYEQRDVLMEKMDYIKHVATAMGYSQRWEELEYACSCAVFTSGMSDRAAVQTKFNKLIAEVKQEKLKQIADSPIETRAFVAEEFKTFDSYSCFVHKVMNLGAAFEAAMLATSNGSKYTGITASLEFDGTEDLTDNEEYDDVDPLYEDGIIKVISSEGSGSSKRYLCLWVSGDKVWEDVEDIEGTTALKEWESDKSASVPKPAKKKGKTRAQSKGKQLQYEIHKYFVLGGDREDMQGENFMVWAAERTELADKIKIHLNMKPMRGTRYIVHELNAPIHYECSPTYRSYLEYRKKEKGHYNRQ